MKMREPEIVDLTTSPARPTEHEEECPLCFLRVPASELQAHCDAHFASEDNDAFAAAAGPSSFSHDAPAFSTFAATMDDVECPLCGQLVPLGDLSSHEALHEVEFQGGIDGNDNDAAAEAKHFRALQEKYGFAQPAQRPGTCRSCGEAGHWARDCPCAAANVEAQRRIVCDPTHAGVVAAQRADSQHRAYEGELSRPGEDLLRLLGGLLQGERAAGAVLRHTALLSGPLGYFGGQARDFGWGCGYRNLQMQASHLLATRADARKVLFGGTEAVPDLPSLQAWIEVAWRGGFDLQGAEQLGGAVQGSKKWIGTTEAATVLRYFGVPATIVDFGDGRFKGENGHGSSSSGGRLEDGGQTGSSSGEGFKCNACGVLPIQGPRFRSMVLPARELCGRCAASPAAAAIGPMYQVVGTDGRRNHTPCGSAKKTNNSSSKAGGGGSGGGRKEVSPAGRALLRWVWRYFNAAAPGGALSSGNTVRLSFTGQPPLYFQHDGHSRTIVGVERREPRDGSPAELSLLLFDPGTGSASLRTALESGRGWQKLLRRGAHTLWHEQYQVCYSPAEGKVWAPDAPQYAALKMIAAAERHQ